MKHLKMTKFATAIIAFCCFNYSVFSQCETGTIDDQSMHITPNQSDNSYTFNLDAEDDDVVIWFFGDGHYATGSTVRHTYTTSGSHPVTAYKSSGYVPDPPSIYKGDTDGNLTGTLIPNYGTSGTIYNGVEIALNTSWNIIPAEGNFHYFMVTLRNTNDTNFSGSAQLSSDPAVSFDHTECLLPPDLNNMAWYSTPSSSGDSGIFDFSLAPNQVSQFYVRASLQTDYNLRQQPFLDTKLELLDVDKNGLGTVQLTSRVSLFPHDPNSITVLQESVCPLVDVPQELDKIIHFENIGDFDAEDVKLLIFNASHHEPNTVLLVDDSHDMAQLFSNGPVNRIIFEDIFLPGLAQNSPKQFAPSECSGWVHLRFTVLPCVDPDAVIKSQAQIVFDSLAPIMTNSVTTKIDKEKCDGLPLCEDIVDTDNDQGHDFNGHGGHGRTAGRSVNHSLLDQINALPNPFQNQFQIDIPAVDMPITIKVYDMRGMKVYEENIPKDNPLRHMIYTESWSDGLYLMHIYHAEKSKIIKCLKQG